MGLKIAVLFSDMVEKGGAGEGKGRRGLKAPTSFLLEPADFRGCLKQQKAPLVGKLDQEDPDNSNPIYHTTFGSSK